MRRITQTSAIALVCVVVGSACSSNASARFPPPTFGAFSDAEPDLVNPLRGQYENLLTQLFPQANPAQHNFPAWPGTTDVSARIDWRMLQPRDPRTLPPNAPDDQKYDFTLLDQAIDNAASNGQRFGFRITAFNSCCDTDYPNNTDISMPDWMQSIDGAAHTYHHNGVAYVIPDWNNATYLSYFSELLAALGRRYDSDERVAVFEMSGYGDFSENQVSFMRDDLGLPGPGPDDSDARLGYFSQYREQYITKASVDFLVTANLSAFPNTQVIATLDNPEIAKQVLRDNPILRNRRKPVGIRADGLGVYRPIPTWAENPDSHYVKVHDPIVDVVATRFRIAPIVTEWIPEVPPDESVSNYYVKGLMDVVNDHVSMTASTGFPGQLYDDAMSPADFDVWARANKFSGYRYAVETTGDVPTVASGTTVRIPLLWTNFGSAPTYEDWQPEYDIVSASGQVVKTVTASINLRGLVANQHFDNPHSVPAWKSTTDILTVGDGLSPGTYWVRVRVVWQEHKPRASHTVNFPPMQLPLGGRNPDGSYPVATFTVQ